MRSLNPQRGGWVVQDAESGAPPAAGPTRDTLGVYVHVPFCDRVCPYCDFAVVGGGVSPELEARYVDALLAELDQRSGDVLDASTRLVSLYLGGGTPSLLEPSSIARVVEAVRALAPPVAAGIEVTLEVNPGTTERARLPGFRRAGVDRLSIGAQSFDDTVLRRLGRAHRAEEIRHAVAAARGAGFGNVSLDLMFAAPGQTLATLEADLDALLALAPEHVSTYELVVEPGTPFERAAERGRLGRVDEDGAAAMLDTIERRLSAAGFERYELTNHARPGHASRHNLRYWEREPVLGLGVGAWSCEPVRPGAPHGGRRANARGLGPYLQAIEAGASAAVESEVLDPETARGEALFLGLRSRGVSAARFAAEFGAPPRHWFSPEVDELRAAGLLAENARGDLSLTARGQLLADRVGEAFVVAPSEDPAR